MTFVEAKNQASQIVRFPKKFEEAESVLDRASRAEAAARDAERRKAEADSERETRREALETVIADLEEHRRIATARTESAREEAREADAETRQLVTERRAAVADEIARLSQSLDAARADHAEALARLRDERKAEEEKLEEARDRRVAFIASITGDA